MSKLSPTISDGVIRVAKRIVFSFSLFFLTGCGASEAGQQYPSVGTGGMTSPANDIDAATQDLPEADAGAQPAKDEIATKGEPPVQVHPPYPDEVDAHRVDKVLSEFGKRLRKACRREAQRADAEDIWMAFVVESSGKIMGAQPAEDSGLSETEPYYLPVTTPLQKCAVGVALKTRFPKHEGPTFVFYAQVSLMPNPPEEAEGWTIYEFENSNIAKKRISAPDASAMAFMRLSDALCQEIIERCADGEGRGTERVLYLAVAFSKDGVLEKTWIDSYSSREKGAWAERALPVSAEFRACVEDLARRADYPPEAALGRTGHTNFFPIVIDWHGNCLKEGPR